MGRIRWISAALGASLVGVVLVPGAPAAADQVVLSCNASAQKATLNPPIGSGDSRYYKSVSKPTGSATCTVDPGIVNHDPATDSVSGKVNPFDQQTNGHTTLTTLSSVSTTSGTITCNTTDPTNQFAWPWTYPGQGKLVTKFVETDSKGKNLSVQAYIRTGKDAADPDPYDIVISGIVTKGIGVGGTVHAVVTLFPDLFSTKNLNIADCGAASAAGNASISVMDVTPTDGSDPGTAVDPWTVSLPS